MKTDLLIEEVKHVAMSQVMPEEWHSWIFCALSEDAPFSWGDNNLSLVSAERFLNHLEDVLDLHDDENTIKEHKESVIDTLNYLSNKNIYIDLES
jgi:hypothetical protein